IEYERQLMGSPDRRDELVSAAAWLDEIEAKTEAPPAELTAFALKLDNARPEPHKPSRFVAFIERLFPGPRLALATSAIASVAIVAVGLDVALKVNPGLMPSHELAGPPAQVAHTDRPFGQPRANRPDGPSMVYPTRQAPVLQVAVSPELRNA